MSIIIRQIRSGESAWCEAVLRALPDWFGIESSLLEYVRDTEVFETWITESGGVAAGFVTVRLHNPLAAEIHCVAVLPEAHRHGIGRAMVQFVEQHLQARGVRVLQVKTLGPSRPDEHYEQTRRFYEAMGFIPLEEFKNLWPGNPCLVLVKEISPRAQADARSG